MFEKRENTPIGQIIISLIVDQKLDLGTKIPPSFEPTKKSLILIGITSIRVTEFIPHPQIEDHNMQECNPQKLEAKQAMIHICPSSVFSSTAQEGKTKVIV